MNIKKREFNQTDISASRVINPSIEQEETFVLMLESSIALADEILKKWQGGATLTEAEYQFFNDFQSYVIRYTELVEKYEIEIHQDILDSKGVVH